MKYIAKFCIKLYKGNVNYIVEYIVKQYLFFNKEKNSMKFIKKSIVIYILIVSFIIFIFSSNKTTFITKNTNSSNEKVNENIKIKSYVLSSTKEKLSKENVKNIEKDRVSNIVYKREDITIESGVKKEELENVFKNYKGASSMTHLSKAFVDAEELYGVNAFTMAAIVALESGFATSRRAIEDNNLTGFEVYTDESKGKLFSTQYESVIYTAKHLANNYLTKGAIYYEGVSVDDVQIHYCPDEGKNKEWEVKVDKLASGFLDVYKELYVNE